MITHQGANAQGCLYMAATHLGNVQDVPLRTLDLLRSVDLVVGEEARPLQRLLRQAGLTRSFLLYNEHGNEALTEADMVWSRGGSVLYVSDQGTPNFADPGHELVFRARHHGVRVLAIPGPSSITAAISVCPFPLTSYVFLGFLPQKTEQRYTALKTLPSRPLIILETPYRWKNLLQALHETIPHRQGFLALDLTGPEEQHLSGSWATLMKEAKRLNGVLIVEAENKNKR